MPGTIIPLQQVLPTSTPIAMTPTEDSWIIVDLPEDATQPGSELNFPSLTFTIPVFSSVMTPLLVLDVFPARSAQHGRDYSLAFSFEVRGWGQYGVES